MKATLIRNPNAGRRHHGQPVQGAADILERAGWELRTETTGAPGDTARITRAAVAEGMDAVLVAGGDGTVNEAVQALAGSETALGFLPFGTVNIWARELGLPLHPMGAAHELAAGRIEQVDLGMIDDRYFLLMAGIGFDGAVVRRAQTLERHKQRFGVLPYIASGLAVAPFYRGADIELRYDGLIRKLRALMVVVANTRLYGGRFRMTPKAVANDGWLDLCVIKGHGPLAMLRQSVPLFLSGSVAHSDVELLRVRELSITSEAALPVQVDGELAGETPARVSVASKALKVIVPPDFDSSLIA
ncbi:MAG: diacylglycerol/lipid kinase family protein [Chloroflexota bacterium]